MSSSPKDEKICQCAGSASLGQHEVIVLSLDSERSDIEIM